MGFIKKNWKLLFWCLFTFLLILLYINEWRMLDKKLMTIFDEGYYYLTLQKANNNEPNVGISQWPYFISSLTNDNFLSDILNLRYLRYGFRIFTFIVFALLTGFTFLDKKNRKEFPVFFTIVSAMSFFSIGDMIITSNYLQEFNLLMIAVFCLLSYRVQKSYWLILSGFFSFISLLIIPPSGLLVSLACIVLLILLYRKNTKMIFNSVLFYVVGFILSAAFVHVFIVDIQTIYQNIYIGTKYLMNANRGYGLIDHMIRLLFYFRDFFIQTSLILGLYAFSYVVTRKIKPFLGWLLFAIGMLVFIYYAKKPAFNISTLWAFPIVLYVLQFLNTNDLSISSIKKMNIENVFINTFLFLLPLISVIGTNTPYASKMIVFILPWSLLLFNLYLTNNKSVNYKTIVMTVLAIPFLMVVKNFELKNDYSYKLPVDGPASRMYLNHNQYQYFMKIDSLFNAYNFHKNQDYVFATTFDHMTIVTFQAKALETFQLPEDYLQYRKKEMLPSPKFIFMTEYDKQMLSDEFKKRDWGFPEKYDQYFIGTPDPEAIWKTERWLYCKKNN